MRSSKRMLFLDLVLSVFRLNGLLISEGDAMTENLGLTSARWKVIGDRPVQCWFDGARYCQGAGSIATGCTADYRCYGV